MPSDAFDDNTGGILNWDSQTLLPNPAQEHWYPATSSAPANLLGYHPNYDVRPQFINSSAIDPPSDPAASRADVAFANDQEHNLDFDVHQGQYWSDLPSQHHVITAPTATLLSNASAVTTHFPVDESTHNQIYSVAEAPPQANLGEGTARDRSYLSTSTVTSPSQSVTSASKALEPESTRHQRLNRQDREAPPPNPISKKVSGFRSSNGAHGGSNRKTHPPIPKGTPLSRMYSTDVTEARDEDEPKKNPFGSFPRGSSAVSSASGQSHGGNSGHRSEGQDAEFKSAWSRSEKAGIETIPGVLRTRPGSESEDGQRTLPHAKGFSIQIGSEVFRLSGASILSDGQYNNCMRFATLTENSRAPSYFSRFFEEQLQHDDKSATLRPLYIDRDPATFRDICRHLQGEIPNMIK